MTNAGLLEHQGETIGLAGEWRLSPSGWRYLRELERTGRASNQAFVAMSFDESLKPAWTNAIQPALLATGFRPVLANDPPHNENIMDKIRAEIRRSGLLVADFTRQSNGVYFEVGFAMGLGIPVIRTCHADDFDNKKLHFDQSQWLILKWKSVDELQGKLITHIEATIPGHLAAKPTK